MYILIIGGHGTIGSCIASDLKRDHHVVTAGRSSGDMTVDITNMKSIHGLFELAGPLDAIICCAMLAISQIL